MINTTTPTLVITGGLGFIFSHVTEYFVKKGWNVIVIDNLSIGSHQEIIDDSFNFIEMNVSDEKVIHTIVDINPDFVIHAAANSDVDNSIKSPLFVIKQNILGNLNLFEAARRCSNLNKFLYISSDEVYGECDHRKTEDEIIFPRNPYSCSKATGSLLRLAFDNSFPELKDRTAETRFCNVFGPRQDSRKIIPRIIQALKTGDPVPVHNTGIGRREYLYVSNIPPLVELVLLNGIRTYNITDNSSFTVNELIEMIEKITHKKVPTTQRIRPGMDVRYSMNSSRIRNELGWKPILTFEKGLENLLKQEKLL